MEELIHHNLAITYELLNQPDDAISSYTLVRNYLPNLSLSQ